MSSQIFSEVLQNAGGRIVQKTNPARIFLDKNEQPNDIDDIIKQEVLDELNKVNWNRYPGAQNTEIEKLVAAYAGLNPENIAVAPGSASIITTLLNYFAINRKQIVIAQPSYTLFDYHCKTYGINYESWYLNSSLEFDLELLPKLSENSILILASPNNPVGNTISATDLENIVQHNSNSLIIIDGVYIEFGNSNFNSLIHKYNNLIVLRSFSKAFPAAGVRLGYLCAGKSIVSVVKKLILLFSVNQFSQVFAKVVLNNPAHLMNIENRLLQITCERDHLYARLREMEIDGALIVKKPEGNFILVKIPNTEKFNMVLTQLYNNGIQVLNTSNLAMLYNTFRVSVGTTAENNAFMECIKSIL
jgi:histidinol-phosphate aminotransferase